MRSYNIFSIRCFNLISRNFRSASRSRFTKVKQFSAQEIGLKLFFLISAHHFSPRLGYSFVNKCQFASFFSIVITEQMIIRPEIPRCLTSNMTMQSLHRTSCLCLWNHYLKFIFISESGIFVRKYSKHTKGCCFFS